ncbi:MAG: hypothetical protein SGI88_00465, partial [Candidatus Hydrogenedentes bacterium]|nr:hypothetical protein [Candidatus Hydrogenedentota bacterium]
LAESGDVDLVAKGDVAGFPRGWSYAGSNLFTADAAADPAITTANLVALAATGSEITFVVVQSGLTSTLGIDRDDDATLDFDEFVLEDNDGDGIANGIETGADTDSDGLKNYLDLDSDSDSLSDEDEFSLHGTNPLSANSDGDGLPDAWEIANGLDPNDDGSVNPDNGALGDPDNDGFTNMEEFIGGSDPQDNSSTPPSVPAASAWALLVLCAVIAIVGRRRFA